MLHFTDAELQSKAEQLGLVQPGQPIPTAVTSKVKAALVEERRAGEQPKTSTEPVCAKQIVIEPDGAITVDGEPFPWVVARTPIEVHVDPDGFHTARMTLIAESVQVLPPKKKNTESE